MRIFASKLLKIVLLRALSNVRTHSFLVKKEKRMSKLFKTDWVPKKNLKNFIVNFSQKLICSKLSISGQF